MKRKKISTKDLNVLLKHDTVINWKSLVEEYEIPLENINCGSITNPSFWLNISKYSNLPEQFIEKHKNKLDWKFISTHRKLSDLDKAKIKELYRKGYTIRKIARIFKDKCSRRTIQFVLFPERMKKQYIIQTDA